MVVLHTCELHEVNGSALPNPLLSNSQALEVFTSIFNIPKITIHHGGVYCVSIFIDISKGNSTFVVSLFDLCIEICPLFSLDRQ